MIKPEHNTDYELAHKYLCDDIEAGRELFSRVYEPVRKYIIAHTYGYLKAEREDILNETMQRCVRKLDTYNGKSSFLTFVCKYAKNVILEQARRKNRDSEVLSLDELRDTEDEPVDLSLFMNPEAYVLKKEKQQQIQATFNSLSDDHKLIIKLKLFEGMTFKEISELTKQSVEALESMFYRAVKAFRKKFEKF